MAGVDLKITCHQAERRSYQGFHVVPVKLSPRLMTFLNIAPCDTKEGAQRSQLSNPKRRSDPAQTITGHRVQSFLCRKPMT